MDKEKLIEIDRRALGLKMSLSTLGAVARVGNTTMARLRANPERASIRTINKLLTTLEDLERGRDHGAR